MTTEKEIAQLFNEILDQYIKEIEAVAHEENSQATNPPTELLNDGIKELIDLCLSILTKLYGEYIKPEGAHIQNALELIPLFSVFGMWIGAQLGVSRNEYDLIVDYYLERMNLMETKE